MTTDYGTDEPVTRVELLARVLIAMRDHQLPTPNHIQLIDRPVAYRDNAATPLLGFFVDTVAEADAWLDFLPPGRMFYGWKVGVSSLERTYKPTPVTTEVRAVVDAAVADYEPTAELFEPVPVVVFAPTLPTKWSATHEPAPCHVPYIHTAPGAEVQIVSRCVRPSGHLGDHADVKSHQWPNTYTGPAYRSVTP